MPAGEDKGSPAKLAAEADRKRIAAQANLPFMLLADVYSNMTKAFLQMKVNPPGILEGLIVLQRTLKNMDINPGRSARKSDIA